MTGPVVSIVIPVLNSERWLDAALVSVLQQDYPWLQLIVKDGGSTDGTPAVVQQHGDRVVWISQPDSGIANAVNQGWAQSSGEILGWIGSDDGLEPGALRAVVDFFVAHPSIEAVYGDCAILDEAGRTVDVIRPGPFDRKRILGWNYIADPATFVRRPLLERVGWLDESLRNVMDHDLWIKFAIRGSMAYLPQTLARFRVHAASMTNRHVRRAGDETIRVVTRAFDDPAMPAELRAARPQALGEAYLRAGMCYYAAQDLSQARAYLRQALHHAPGLMVDPRFARTFGASLLGRSLITRLRRLRRRRGVPAAAQRGDPSTWQLHP